MKIETATRISKAALEVGSILDSLCVFISENEDVVAARTLQLRVGKVMGEVLFELMNPTYDEFPELRPPELEA